MSRHNHRVACLAFALLMAGALSPVAAADTTVKPLPGPIRAALGGVDCPSPDRASADAASAPSKTVKPAAAPDRSRADEPATTAKPAPAPAPGQVNVPPQVAAALTDPCILRSQSLKHGGSGRPAP